MDGFSASEIFNDKIGYTYDDFIILPHFIYADINSITLDTKLTRNITLKRPLVSSPMDTVTESKMAIGLALQGGIGIIHCNNTIAEQVEEVRKVKRFNNGFIYDPIVFSPNNTVSDIINAKKQYGFNGYPITIDGKLGSKLVGIVSKKDLDLEDEDTLIKTVMTSRENMISGHEDVCDLNKAHDILKKQKISKLPIVDENDNLIALICRKDLIMKTKYPFASYNKEGTRFISRCRCKYAQ